MKQIDICNELKQNFIDFAYEANSQRAFPDARDGLKPGQRACLWEFFTKGFTSAKPHVKCAKISGGVIATWWPHGDSAIYDTFARMSQPWINNIPEVDWHGSNGNIVIGSSPASSRYTEARLNKPIEEGMFNGVKKNIVPMILNFSEDEEWPEVLPALFPRLMVNGSQGIGVSVAQNWLPHNLAELCEIIKNYITTNNIDYSNIAPDFPTGGIIINKNELSNIYTTGKGKAILRGRTEIKGNNILITELPYQVYVEPFIEEVKELIANGSLVGIDEIYNKTDKNRLLIEIECNSSPASVLSKLFTSTSLQKSYSANQCALVGKTPKLLTLQEYLDIYINHNINCIRNEYTYDLNKAKSRMEIVDGLIKALENIDNIITLIKNSESANAARINLQNAYDFTENQSKAIVDMKLGRLARLEAIELNEEKTELNNTISNCLEMINNNNKLNNEFLIRLNTFAKRYGSTRKTELAQIKITKEEKEIQHVEPEKCVVIMTEGGLIKRVPASAFKTQKRNGKGVKTQDDITNAIIRTNTIDSLIVFSDYGKMYRLLVNDIPSGTNSTKGTPIKTLIQMENNENPSVIYSIYRDTDAEYVLFVTKQGMIKKTALDEYINTKKKNGMQAIKLKEGDNLAAVSLIKDGQIMLFTQNGYGMLINSKDLPVSSRIAMGVKGIGLKDDDQVVTALPVRDKTDCVALFSANGLGKRVEMSEFVSQKRGGRGFIYYKVTDASGKLAAASLVAETDQILVVGNKASICIKANEIPIVGRASVGNLIIKNSNITSVSKV